jgi:hypothetical protein
VNLIGGEFNLSNKKRLKEKSWLGIKFYNFAINSSLINKSGINLIPGTFAY